MNPKEYVKNVLVTEARDFAPLQERFSQVRNIRLLHGALGLASELAEIRQMADQDVIDAVNLKEEIGDVFWYMGIMVDELKADPDDVFNQSTIILAKRDDPEERREMLNFLVNGMTIAIGEGIDLLKKSLMYGKELNINGLIQKLKNVNDYSEASLRLYGLTSESSRERNIEKLRARYGEKFTEAAALERNLAVEREILEKK